MANTVRIKRRVSGATGAPSSLQNAEVAYNEVDDTLYYGKGTGGAGGSATSAVAIAGPGAFLALTGNQTIGGTKTFSNTIGGSVSGNAGTATALASGRTIAITGDIGYTSPSFDGSQNVTSSATLASTGVTAGTYTKVTVDAKGRATSGSSLSASDVTTALNYTPVSSALLGAANGVATLDSGGKVTAGQLPASVAGGLNYQGVWNATTNTPALVSGVGTKGHFYKVTTAGSTTIDGINDWSLGDMIAYNGATWDKIDGGINEVISVAGRTGAVALAYADISGLASMAQQAANSVAITGGSITNLTTFDGITIDGGTF